MWRGGSLHCEDVTHIDASITGSVCAVSLVTCWQHRGLELVEAVGDVSDGGRARKWERAADSNQTLSKSHLTSD